MRRLLLCTTALACVGLAGCSSEPEAAATSESTRPEVLVMVGLGMDDADWSYCTSPGPTILVRSLRVDGGTARFSRPEVSSDGAPLEAKYSYAPVTEPVDGYILAGEEPAVDVARAVGWAERKPLSGAELRDGDYALIVRVDGPAGTALRDGSFAWAAGEESGTAVAPWNVRFEKDCDAPPTS